MVESPSVHPVGAEPPAPVRWVPLVEPPLPTVSTDPPQATRPMAVRSESLSEGSEVKRFMGSQHTCLTHPGGRRLMPECGS